MSGDRKKQYNFRLRKSTIEYIDATFPSYGFRQWFVENCVEELRRKHEDGEIESHVDLVALTVKEVSG